MKKNTDLRVAIMDHDSFALRGLVGLVSRDCRVSTIWEAGAPEELLQIARQYPLDLIIIDVEYSPQIPALRHFLAGLGQLRPQAALIGTANHLAMDLVLDTIESGANGLFEKEEIYKGIVHGALRSQPGKFLYTRGVFPFVKDLPLSGVRLELVPSWQPNPVLTEEMQEIFVQCVEGGLRNATVAKRFGLKPQTVDTYISRIYGALIGSGQVDDQEIRALNLDELSSQELAYLYYTALPSHASSRQDQKAARQVAVNFASHPYASKRIRIKKS